MTNQDLAEFQESTLAVVERLRDHVLIILEAAGPDAIKKDLVRDAFDNVTESFAEMLLGLKLSGLKS